jgi:hypothetical protein
MAQNFETFNERVTLVERVLTMRPGYFLQLLSLTFFISDSAFWGKNFCPIFLSSERVDVFSSAIRYAIKCAINEVTLKTGAQ